MNCFPTWRPLRATILLSDELKDALRRRGRELGVGYQTAAKMILAKFVNARLRSPIPGSQGPGGRLSGDKFAVLAYGRDPGEVDTVLARLSPRCQP